jgi:hypothetical protein
MTLGADRAVVLAPRDVLLHPPGPLYVLLPPPGGTADRWRAVAEVRVPEGQPVKAERWTAMVRTVEPMGPADDLQVGVDRQVLERAVDAHPTDPWAALEAAGLIPSGSSAPDSVPDVAAWALPTDALTGVGTPLPPPGGEPFRPFWCRYCPLVCLEPQPEPEP